jgi:hypothetical protein
VIEVFRLLLLGVSQTARHAQFAPGSGAITAIHKAAPIKRDRQIRMSRA